MPADPTSPLGERTPPYGGGIGLSSSTPGGGAAAGADTDALIGQTLDGYHVLRRLGRGGMGEVFLAEHAVLGRKTALKVLPAGWLVTADRVDRFHREARLAAQLDHPNVVRVFHAGSQGDLHFLVLEYVEGESLGDRVERRGRLPLDEALNLIEQAARGLAAAHKRGIIHRDIKPANLLVASDGACKVADFGLARELMAPSDLTGSNQVLGTPSFMSPEQVEARPLDARTDVFSLGATLYCLLTGKLPFQGDTAVAVLYQIVHQAPKPLSAACPETPPAVQELVSSLLEKAPERRPQSMELVASMIAAVRKGLGAGALEKTTVQTGPPPRRGPTNASAPTPMTPVAPPAGSAPGGRGRVVALAVGALVLGGIGVWAWTRSGSTERAPRLAPSEGAARVEGPAATPDPPMGPVEQPPKASPPPDSPPQEPAAATAHGSIEWPTDWDSIYSRQGKDWLRSSLPGSGWSADQTGATVERHATPLETQIREWGFLAEIEVRYLEGPPCVDMGFGSREAEYRVRWEEGKSITWHQRGEGEEELYTATPKSACAGRETHRIRLLYQTSGVVALEVNGEVLLSASDPTPLPKRKSGFFLSFGDTRAHLAALEISIPSDGRPPR